MFIWDFYNKYQLCYFSCSPSNMLSTMPLTSVLDNRWTQAKSCFKAVVTIFDVSHKAVRLTHPEENLKATASLGWRAPGKSSLHPCSELPHSLFKRSTNGSCTKHYPSFHTNVSNASNVNFFLSQSEKIKDGRQRREKRTGHYPKSGHTPFPPTHLLGCGDE